MYLLLRLLNLHQANSKRLSHFAPISGETLLDQQLGILGAMLNNADLKDKGIALIDSLADTGSSIEEIVADAREGRSGLLGKLLGDDTLAQEFRDLVAHLKVVTARLENGEGSIGKLLAEDDAYTELMKSLRSLNGQLEDAREAQPVSTFTQMLFGRF